MNEQTTPEAEFKILYPVSNGRGENVAITKPEDLPAKSVVTIGELGHFAAPTDEVSRDLAKELAKSVSATLGIAEDRMFAFARSGSLGEMGENFGKQYLLPKLSKPGESGKLVALDMEEALNNARINIVTHSFGQRLANNMGKQLIEDLQNPDIFEKPYTQEQAQAIGKQILVVGLGGALNYDYLKMAEGGTAYEAPETPLNNIGIYNNGEETVRAMAEAYPDSFIIKGRGHSQDSYLAAMSEKPQAIEAINALMNADRLPDNASVALDGILQRASVLNNNPELDPKRMFDMPEQPTASIDPKLQGLAAIEGITIQDNKVLFTKAGDEPKEILTIKPTADGIELDPEFQNNQRANLGNAMNASPELQNYVLDNSEGIFTDRATIMARHQIEAKIKKGELDSAEEGQKRNYDFEPRIRGDMAEKEARKQEMRRKAEMDKFEVPNGIIFGFPGDAPTGRPPVLQPVDPLEPDEKIVEENRNTLNRHAKEEKRLLDSAIPMQINSGDTITIGGLDHFQGSEQDVRLRNTMKFPAELADSMGMSPEKFKALMIPQKIKDSLPEFSDDALGEYIATNTLLQRVTRQNGDSLEKIPLDEAKANMRLNFVTHSFGGKLASKMIESLEKQMTDEKIVQPPYTKDEAKAVLSQVLQFDLGPAMGYDFLSTTEDNHVAFDPASTRAQAYLPKDPDLNNVMLKINMGADDIQNAQIYLLNTPEPPGNFTSWSSDYNFNGAEQHTRALYVESMRNNPQLIESLGNAIRATTIDRDAVLQEFSKSMHKLDVTLSSGPPALNETEGKELNSPAKQQARGT